MEDLYTENYKLLLKRIKEDINKWKNILCSWIGRLNIVKMSVLLKTIYRLSATPTKISIMFFAEIEKSILKSKLQQWKQRGTGKKERHTNQLNRIESTGISPHILYIVKWFSVRVAILHSIRKRQSFNKWSLENWIVTWKMTKLNPYQTPIYKN